MLRRGKTHDARVGTHIVAAPERNDDDVSHRHRLCQQDGDAARADIDAGTRLIIDANDGWIRETSAAAPFQVSWIGIRRRSSGRATHGEPYALSPFATDASSRKAAG